MTKKRLTFGMENLEARQLMAADLGVGGDFAALPSLPADQAEVSSMVVDSDQAPAMMMNDDGFQIAPNWNTNRLNLIISGTEYNDEIKIDRLDNGYIRVTGTTTNDAGTQLGQNVEDFHPNAFVHIFAALGDGEDVFDNNVDTKTALVYGGNDDDVLTSEGRASLFGQGGDDVLWGSKFNDYISGGAGEDFIYGRDGDDTLDGGSFSDLMYGGRGDDTMDGDSGFDRMYGHSGNDVMRGGVGEDFMDGGWDDDILFGGDHDDTLEGGSGNDVIRGQKGNDRLEGESGDDRLDGGSGDDLLLGGDDNDELIGRGGFDRLFGGGDNDILDGGDDGIQDILHGGTGSDTFVRHKHVWTDDPDLFFDFLSGEDHRENDWAWANYGNDFPEEGDYF